MSSFISMAMIYCFSVLSPSARQALNLHTYSYRVPIHGKFRSIIFVELPTVLSLYVCLYFWLYVCLYIGSYIMIKYLHVLSLDYRPCHGLMIGIIVFIKRTVSSSLSYILPFSSLTGTVVVLTVRWHLPGPVTTYRIATGSDIWSY
jgi:hypothetical protein